jgi:hypothetical protein
VLLVEFGLGVDGKRPWRQRFGSRLISLVEMLHDQFEVAARRNPANRTGFLVDIGPVGTSAVRDCSVSRDAEGRVIWGTAFGGDGWA